MTAIALLNPKLDPHIVADTLLSADGLDPNSPKKIWLPALGHIQSEWDSNAKPWHISRLGRKSFILPNESGVLAFAGNCSVAFNFWAAFCDAFLNLAQYNKKARVHRDLIDRTLYRLERAHELTLLGILIGDDGVRDEYIHNSPKKLQTTSFGDCYVAGSGASLIEEIILNEDARIIRAGGWPKTTAITATENLAEKISADMLYREGDFRNGLSQDTPIGAQCGGFYEWYGIQEDGIRPMQSRIDLHAQVEDGKLVITRIYFSEQLQMPDLTEADIPSGQYCISVLNLGLFPYTIELNKMPDDGYTITPEENYGVIIESTFNLYDQPSDKQKIARISGPLQLEALKVLFPHPLDVRRVRLVVKKKEGAIGKGFVSRPDNAQLALIDGRLNIRLSDDVSVKMYEIALRPSQEYPTAYSHESSH